MGGRLVGYWQGKHSREVELGATKNIIWQSEQDLKLGPTDFKSSTLTTPPYCLNWIWPRHEPTSLDPKSNLHLISHWTTACCTSCLEDTEMMVHSSNDNFFYLVHPDQWLSALVWTGHGIVTVLRSFLKKKMKFGIQTFCWNLLQVLYSRRWQKASLFCIWW